MFGAAFPLVRAGSVRPAGQLGQPPAIDSSDAIRRLILDIMSLIGGSLRPVMPMSG